MPTPALTLHWIICLILRTGKFSSGDKISFKDVNNNNKIYFFVTSWGIKTANIAENNYTYTAQGRLCFSAIITILIHVPA